MKKIVSSLIAGVMIMSAFMTTTFAAGNTFTLAADKEESYAAGETVTVTVELTGTDEFAGFNAYVDFDNTAFTAVSAAKTKRTDWGGSLTFGQTTVANNSGQYYVQYVNADNDGFADEEWYSLTYKFTVNDNASGDYTFDFVINEMKDNAKNNVTATAVPVTINVEKAEPQLPVPSISYPTAEEVAATEVDGKVTKAALVTIPHTADTKAATAVDVTVNAPQGTKKTSETYSFDLPTTVKDGGLKVAINVLGVPTAVADTITFSAAVR